MTHTIIKEGDYYILKRHIFPQFEAIVDIFNPVTYIKDIVYFERCSIQELDVVMNELGNFIRSIYLKLHSEE